MGRTARIVVPGCPHHVTQRGNRGVDIFADDEDRHAYLRFLRRYAVQYGLAIWAYCLMGNHVHLVVVPEREESLARTLHDAHTVYAMRFNSRMQVGGHLWQARFYSAPMDDEHLWAAVRYVERNPVRAGMVKHAADYPWSSAAAHCGIRHDALLSPEFPPPGQIEDWPEWLRNDGDTRMIARIRRQTHTGKPCGDDEFLSALERKLGRSVKRKKPGPKPKQGN